MNYAEVELILMQYSYRKAHATTTTELTDALDQAVKKILELHAKSKGQENEPK
jgi:hypothetical protein